jgi:chromosome segregation ATPase
MGPSETRLIDFAQARVNRIADAIDGLGEHIKATNLHVERLHREVGEMRSEVGSLRSEMDRRFSEVDRRFDHLHHELHDARSEVILQANQILNAQQQATRAMLRLDDIERPPDEPVS